jgi:hypothetical protein
MNKTKQEVLNFINKYSFFFKKPDSWFDENWHIVEEFEKRTLDIIAKGRTHYSARTIVEVLVHDSILRETNGMFKIGNDNAPDLARVFVVQHPEYVDFWEYRRPDSPVFKKLFKKEEEIVT